MITIPVNASLNYDVVIGKGLLQEAGQRISAVTKASSAMIVSDDNVYPLYGSALKSALEAAGIHTASFVFPHGEKSKCLKTYGELLEHMCIERITRKDIIVALGGGVVGDLAGFTAATYQRGIRFVQIPTTLLAAVDSSVGGKTAVDLENGKNMVGCFYQPSLVLCDIDTLQTLPDVEYRCGCAEIIKYAMIENRDFYDSLYNTPVCEQYEEVIAECVRSKSHYVLNDEFDTGIRMMLNFGHTFAHSVEACSGYETRHGLAVAMGMAVMTQSAYKRGICSKETLDGMLDILKKYDLPTDIPYTKDEMLPTALSDKKSIGGKTRIIVPEEIGRCRIETIQGSELGDWMTDGGIQC